MDNIKIAFIDIDGTLTNSKQMISQENINALKFLKEKNIKIVLSSGRWDTYMLKFNENLNIIDYIISNNGACLIDINEKKVLFERTLNNDDINLITAYCKNNNLSLIYNGLYKRYNINDKINTSIYQGVITCKTKNDIDNLIEFAKNNNLKVPYISYAYYKNIESSKYTINISNKETNKGNTIKYLLDLLNIDKKDSICFGDNDNDIEMFDICGIKVAMENGLNELKEKADYITLDNDNNGVAYFIIKYLK